MFNKTEEKLSYFIKITKELLTTEGFEAVNHYFEHDEFEMCFEGLVIELISNNLYPSEFKFSEWIEIALEYGLDEHSVFDGFFWKNFNQWGDFYDKTV